jgi:hypothetical protein
MGIIRLVLLGFLSGLSVAQVGVAAGQNVSSCKPPTSPIPEAQRKFHPGHYVSIGKPQARNGFGAALSDGIVGVQLRYRWADLEPSEGRYDFSAVARDLETIASSGLQFVAFIEDKSFSDDPPTPVYLRAKYTLPNRQRGYTALRWDPYVNDRLKQLIARLGAQFDCDPHFEGVALQESAPSLDDDALAANGYSPEKYRDALISLLHSAAAGVPRSRVFWYMNFLPGNQKYIGEIASAVIGTGVVMGGPDILPDNPALAKHVYPLYDQFQGRLKLFNSMQHNSYRHRRSNNGGSGSPYWSMEDLLAFARDRLHVDYIFWDYHTWHQPADSHDWVDAREAIARYPTFSRSQER